MALFSITNNCSVARVYLRCLIICHRLLVLWCWNMRIIFKKTCGLDNSRLFVGTTAVCIIKFVCLTRILLVLQVGIDQEFISILLLIWRSCSGPATTIATLSILRCIYWLSERLLLFLRRLCGIFLRSWRSFSALHLGTR